MTVEERQRAEAIDRLTQEIGVDATRAIIDLLPPADVTTRGDFAVVREDFAELREDFAVLREDFAVLRGEVAELREGFATHRAETAEQLERLRAELITVFETGIRQAVTTQTRTLVLSQLGALVALTAIVLGLG